MANTVKKVDHVDVMFQICKNHIDCAHWSIIMHPFIHQTYMATRQKTNKSDIIYLYTFFTHMFKKFNSFLTLHVHATSSKYEIPREHVMWCHIVEHSLSVLHVPTFCIHVNQSIHSKDIWTPSILNDMFMSRHALFNCNYVSTCIQHHHKSKKL